MITHDDLVEAGFEPQTVRSRDTQFEHILCYVLKGWDPLPKVDCIGMPAASARIGSQQAFIRNKDDLERFVSKSVPTFCTLQ